MKALKATIRKSIKLILDEIPSEEKEKQSTIIVQKLFKLPEYRNSKRISIFLSMHDEVHTNDILKDALQSNKKCFIPRYDSKSTYMDMVLLNSWEEYQALPETRWKIKQPPLDKKCITALDSGGLDLVLIPGLAFTKEGHRLGRGRGYYDCFLSKCDKLANPPATIALAYKQQIINEIPMEQTDKPIHVVLTSD